MNIETVRGVLLWSGILNYAFLIVWAMLMIFARGPMHRICRMYGVSAERFNDIQFFGIMLYKAGIFMFFLVPYVAIRIVS